ncbi:Serine/threonine-protein kinase mph1 [Neolecta irregularis DAH-3]|uniref:Serine/threonine-protein kinase mph1 n=1 Tax=Neolecta irregularis (strain DAH-3) TaxID=1198029 RepID=A0A1U7LWW1_NEOID|nr:Serine/threonine-protein kinase mph1 [Neolecta irregularis DAH-3]|eukprot:OLL27124.1 Serine/threonine-protein kinase mph1 [Neolecta irregularis DAH-3]
MPLPFSPTAGDNSLDADPPPPVLDSVLGRLLLAGDTEPAIADLPLPHTRFFRPNSSIRPRKIARARLGPPKRADVGIDANNDGNIDNIGGDNNGGDVNIEGDVNNIDRDSGNIDRDINNIGENINDIDDFHRNIEGNIININNIEQDNIGIKYPIDSPNIIRDSVRSNTPDSIKSKIIRDSIKSIITRDSVRSNTPDSIKSNIIRDSVKSIITRDSIRSNTPDSVKSIITRDSVRSNTRDSIKSNIIPHAINPNINTNIKSIKSINIPIDLSSRSLLSSSLDRSLLSAPPLRTSTPPSSPKHKTTITLNDRTYTRLSIIGRGGSSKVFKVISPDNKIYALKRVSFDKADNSAIQGYKNEIALLKKLAGHDEIVRLYDSEINDHKGYLLMLMEIGEIDLAHILQKSSDQQPDMNFIKFTWKQMLYAVHIIHESKIVHSDLKPANFLMVQGSLKLIDFGIAKAIANDTTNIHRETQVGTVNYMSPEAIRDTGLPGKSRMMKLGRPSDIWSLGCILYQMVYGKLPFGHLTMYQKLQVIPDPRCEILFPDHGSGGLAIDSSLMQCLKGCLCRDPKTRMTIPQLLNHSFLRAPSSTDKVAISVDQMFRLMVETLEYGQKGGDTRPQVVMRLAKDVFDKLKRDS